MARPALELGGKGSRFIILASICLVVAMLYFGYEVLMPLALSMLLAFLLTPVVAWLERRKLGRAPSVLLVVLLSLAGVSALGYLVYQQFTDVAMELPRYQKDIHAKVSRLFSSKSVLGEAAHSLQTLSKNVGSTQPASQPSAQSTEAVKSLVTGTKNDSASDISPQNPLPVRQYPEASPFAYAGEWAGRILSPLATTGIVIVFVIFMLLTREDLRDRIIRLVGHGRLNLTTKALDEAGTRISKYLIAQAIVNACYGLLVVAGLWLIGRMFGSGNGEKGFPNVLLWGLLCCLLRFVPYVGIWMAAAMPLALSFAIFSGNAVFFGTVIMFAAYEVVVSQFVEPYLYGSSTGMSALAVLVSAVFWTWLWGPMGLLLSTPLTVCLVVMGKYVPQLEFLDVLLGDEPVLAPPVRVYQRLISQDQEEAADVAHEFLSDLTLEEVYDQILIPTLVLAERDRARGRLDDERHRYIIQSVNDIVDELAEEQTTTDLRSLAASTEEAAKTGNAAKVKSPRAALPKDCTPINVLCLPAHDRADAVCAAMLTNLLALRGYCSTAVSDDVLASEMVELVDTKKADLVVISALPPAAVTHSRYLCKRLRGRFSDLKLLVGLWATKSDIERARQRIRCDQTVRVITTLADAQDQIEQLIHPTLIAASTELVATPT